MWTPLLGIGLGFVVGYLERIQPRETYYTGNDAYTGVPSVSAHLNVADTQLTQTKTPRAGPGAYTSGAMIPYFGDVRVPKPNAVLVEEAAHGTTIDAARISRIKNAFPLHLDWEYMTVLQEEMSKLMQPKYEGQGLEQQKEYAAQQRKSLEDEARGLQTLTTAEMDQAKQEIKQLEAQMPQLEKEVADFEQRGKQMQVANDGLWADGIHWEQAYNVVANELATTNWDKTPNAKHAKEQEVAASRQQGENKHAFWLQKNAEHEQLKHALAAKNADLSGRRFRRTSLKTVMEQTTPEKQVHLERLRIQHTGLNNQIDHQTQQFHNTNPASRQRAKEEFLRWGPNDLMQNLSEAALRDPEFPKFWANLTSLVYAQKPYGGMWKGASNENIADRYVKQKTHAAHRKITQAIDTAKQKIADERKRNAERYISRFGIGPEQAESAPIAKPLFK